MAITTNGGAGVTADAVATLTNKTLTAPTISDATFTGQQSGLQIAFNQSIVFEGTTADSFETTLTAGDPTADRTITLPDATGQVVLRDTTDTLTNKTLTSPVVNTGILKSPEERLTVSATAATGTVNFDVLTQGVLYYTTNASGNWTLNVRGDGTPTTLNDSLATGDSITIVFLVTQGATAYYSTALTIDGNAVTPKYISGTAFTAGNASSIDSYVYTIIKTGSATFTVLASQTKFA